MGQYTMFQKMIKLRPLQRGKEKFDTLIGPSACIEGSLSLTESVRIDGRVKGDLREADGASISVVIGATGLVKGNVIAGYVVVAGQVQGDIFAKERIEVCAGGTVSGDIRYRTMVVEQGANLQGQLLRVENGDMAGGLRQGLLGVVPEPKSDTTE